MSFTNATKSIASFIQQTKNVLTNFFLLKEDGFYLLLEDGGKIILENSEGIYSFSTKHIS